MDIPSRDALLDIDWVTPHGSGGNPCGFDAFGRGAVTSGGTFTPGARHLVLGGSHAVLRRRVATDVVNDYA
jgi:hypothetical protein